MAKINPVFSSPVVWLIVAGLIVLGFFAVFRNSGKFSIVTKFGKISAEGKNDSPPVAVSSGVKTGKIESGGEVSAHSSAAGGVETGDIKAQGSVSATHTPGQPPPKK